MRIKYLGFLHIAKSVEQHQTEGTVVFVLLTKLKLLKQPPRQLNKQQVGNVLHKIVEALKQLCQIQRNIQMGPFNSDLHVQEKEVISNYNFVVDIERAFPR